MPADSWLPGHSRTHEARCSAEGNQAAGSAPISEMTVAEAPTPIPGIDAISSRRAQKGCISCSICSSRAPIIASS
ncbi:Uncharacterised protein [Mycobacterium tuberculosis]|uniref:Uncharacterized protein n=1 Tax=Mycobacterium tuberculosis TaxID=1773 RepID=A0A916LGP6_MYCTX|nr:Uncharacterised protein [Mycobacterium tuberculosis]